MFFQVPKNYIRTKFSLDKEKTAIKYLSTYLAWINIVAFDNYTKIAEKSREKDV